MAKKGGLGRGLGALIPTFNKEDGGKTTKGVSEKTGEKTPSVKSSQGTKTDKRTKTTKTPKVNKATSTNSGGDTTKKETAKKAGETINKREENQKANEEIRSLEINLIEANSKQPRKSFDEKALKELSESIKKYGVLQPILVQKYTQKGHAPYKIIAGERRYRASILAGLKEIPVVVHQGPPENTEMLSVVENIQREDLNPFEEANSYREIMNKHGLTQQELADALGKSRPYIANAIRLLQLDQESLKDLKDGKLTSSQARALLSEKDPKKREKLRRLLIEGKINVNKAERKTEKSPEKNKYLIDMEERLMESLGTGVSIAKKRKGWELKIACYTNEDLEKLTQILLGGEI